MTSILTGDIVNSKNTAPQLWMPLLTQVLNKYGCQPQQWEIYRGDSFQLEVSPEEALLVCILIKVTIKSIKGLDVRLAIGIGDKSYESEKVTASNGTAFVNSGECFEGLKKNLLAIKTPYEEFDIQMNLFFALAQLIINGWTKKSIEVIKILVENPNLTQIELAKILNKTQSAVSKSLKIAGFEEVMRMENYYRTQILKLC